MDKATFAIVTIMLLIIVAEVIDVRRKVQALDRKLDKVLNSE